MNRRAKEERKLSIFTGVSLLSASGHNVLAASHPCRPVIAALTSSSLSPPLLCSHQVFATTARSLRSSSGHTARTGVTFEPMEESPYLPLCTHGGAAAAASS